MFEKLKNIILNYVEAEPEKVTPDARFIEDLGFNSYDFMSMLGDIETEFGVTVDETEAADIHTVGEAVKYFESLK
ncbi:MAG: acyl carrier protein [Ruminococcus sp.]|nr:acyl carrier protein [Ruminococcus sp.]